MNLANQTNSQTLGNLVILSALITEFFVADILAAEADKIRAAISDTTNVKELAELDNSVARVLDQLCCIEEQIVNKIDQGRQIRNG